MNREEGKLGYAEKNICEKFSFVIEPKKLQISLVRTVYEFTQKWTPYGANEVIIRYIEAKPK